MKNILLMLGAVTTLFIFACKNDNKELIGKIQTNLSTFEPAKDSIVSGHKEVNQLVKAMDKADDNLKRTEKYVELYQQASGMRMKYTRGMNTYIEKLDSLTKLSADIAAGHMADTTAQKKYALFSQDLPVYKSTIGKILVHQTELTTEFEQLQQKFAADPKSFKLAPEQPDANMPSRSNPPRGRQ